VNNKALVVLVPEKVIFKVGAQKVEANDQAYSEGPPETGTK
jgi:hypothetical protein